MKSICPFFGDDYTLPQIYPKSGRFCHSFEHPDEKDAKFVWGIAQQSAVNQLKVVISHHPLLHMANFYKPFILQTEMSSTALRAVLFQETEAVISPLPAHSECTRRKASSVSELKCLAALFETNKFQPHSEQAQFLLQTDNQALSWLLSHSQQLSKTGQWIIKMSSLKFKVQHIYGMQNVVSVFSQM